MNDASPTGSAEKVSSEGSGELAQPLIVAAVCGVSVAVAGPIALGAFRQLFAAGAPDRYGSYLIELAIAASLLLLSGLGLWWRWPWSRQLNLVGASAVAFLWGTNYLDGILWAIPSAILLVQPSVNAFFNGAIIRHHGADETLTPRSLRVFMLIFFALCIAALFFKPFS